MLKIKLSLPKPRNPMVVPGHRRHAGAHRKSPGALRRQAETALRRELRGFERSSP